MKILVTIFFPFVLFSSVSHASLTPCEHNVAKKVTQLLKQKKLNEIFYWADSKQSFNELQAWHVGTGTREKTGDMPNHGTYWVALTREAGSQNCTVEQIVLDSHF